LRVCAAVITGGRARSGFTVHAGLNNGIAIGIAIDGVLAANQAEGQE